jgi:uncharacterized protein YndB with AHSA1/START domain
MATKGRAAPTVSLPSEREVVGTRVFEAPRRLVFEAWSRPEHLRRWIGPRTLTVTECELDLRPGGIWRTVLRGPDGREYAFSGVYREVVPPERLVYTWRFETRPRREALETLTFDEHEGRTTLTTRTRFQSAAELDGWAQSGGRESLLETLQRLAEHLEALAPATP